MIKVHPTHQEAKDALDEIHRRVKALVDEFAVFDATLDVRVAVGQPCASCPDAIILFGRREILTEGTPMPVDKERFVELIRQHNASHK